MGTKRKPKQPTIRQLYNIERGKAKRRIRGLELRGYYFDEPILKEPPKRITRQSIESLKRSTEISTLYKRAKYYSTEGEISGTKARRLERSSAARRGAETRRLRRQQNTSYARKYHIIEQSIDTHYDNLKQRAIDKRDKELEEVRNNKYLSQWERRQGYIDVLDRASDALDEIENQRNRELENIPQRIQQEEQEEREQEQRERTRKLLEQRARQAREDEISEIMDELGVSYDEAEEEYELRIDARFNSAIQEYEDDEDETQFFRNEWATEQGVQTSDYTPRASTQIIDNVQDLINQWQPPEGMSVDKRYIKMSTQITLQSLLNDAIDEYGEDAVAQRLEDYSGEIDDIINTVLYKAYSGEMGVQMARFASILKGSALSAQESKDITEQQEKAYDGMLNGI